MGKKFCLLLTFGALVVAFVISLVFTPSAWGIN